MRKYNFLTLTYSESGNLNYFIYSSIPNRKIGFYGVFTSAAVLYFIALALAVYHLKEKEHDDEKMKALSKKSLIIDFFNFKHTVEAFRVILFTNSSQRRSRVIMLLIAAMVVIGPVHGEMSVLYLFTRYKFNWSEMEFSIFSTYSTLVSLVGTLMSIGILSYYLKLDDAIIGVLSSLSKVVSSLVYGFAMTPFQFYMGPIAEILNGTSFIAMRSIASKLVPKKELVSYQY